MSHLIPTPQTDKNGVTSIRHMRPQSQSSAGSKSIPPVTVRNAAPSPATLGEIARDVLASKSGYHVPIPEMNEFTAGVERLTRPLTKVAPDASETMHRVLTTGSTRAREKCAEHLMNNVKMVMRSTSDTTLSQIDLKMKEIWHGEMVAEESGHVGEIDFSRDCQTIWMETRGFTDEQWRGYAIFRIAFETPEGSRASGEARGFISWAGRQDPEKSALIIEFAQQRKSMDPNLLQELVYSPASGSALRDGLL